MTRRTRSGTLRPRGIAETMELDRKMAERRQFTRYLPLSYLTLGLFAAVLAANAAAAVDDPANVIAYRQKVMSGIGSHIGATLASSSSRSLVPPRAIQSETSPLTGRSGSKTILTTMPAA